jgi:hypothetical protein
MRVLKPIVAEMSPNLYSAAQRANLLPEEQSQLEQMSWAVKKNKELTRMNSADARKAFEGLDPDAQEGLKFFYGDADYMQAPPDFGDRAIGALKFAAKTAVSPLIAVFKVAGAYNRAINTPYLVSRQVAQGENIFSANVWSDAWNGTDVYDNGALKEATDRFGKANIYIAKGLLAGKRPGEILEAYGELTPEIAKAFETAFNEPEEFKQVLDAAKYAQVSLGRDVARMLDTKPPKNGALAGDYIDGTTKNISGFIDFAYQIVIDPFTWITGGASGAARKGSQLAAMVTNAAQSGNVGYGVSRAFKDKGVQTLWNDQLGPAIEKLSQAETVAERAKIRRAIGKLTPGYNNDEAIAFLERNKVFNADEAEKVFSDAENTYLLLSGRVDGITYRRNGIAVARNNRRLSDGFNNMLDSVFNKTVSKQSIDEFEAKGEKAFDVLLKSGENSDKAFNPNIADLFKIEDDIKGLKRFALKAGRFAARNPAGQQILIGDDAVKTIDTVRLVARQVVNRDMADFISQKFLQSSEDEQVVIVRNLYAAVMQRAGLVGDPNGEKLMHDILKRTLNERAGFTTTVKTEIDAPFSKVMSKNALKYENETPLLAGSSAIQPSQLAGAIGPLPYEQIALEANSIRSKKNLLVAAMGTPNSKLAKDFVDFWSIFTLFPRLGVRSAIDEGFMYTLTAPARDLLDFAKGSGRKLNKSGMAYTASNASQGPIAELLRKSFKKNPADLLGIEARNEIIEAIAKREKVSIAEVSHLKINQEIAQRANVFIRNLDPVERDYWTQAMVYHPDLLNSMAQSIAARTTLGGKLDQEIIAEQLNISKLTEALNTIGKEATGKRFKFGKYQEIEVDKLRAAGDDFVTLAHYDNWFIRFATPRQHGKLELPGPYRVSPAVAFFANNGLETPDDLVRAVDGMMTRLGMTKENDFWKVADEAQPALKKFLSYFGDTVQWRQKGLGDEDIAQIYLERMLMDLRDNFHGGPRLYNKELMDKVKTNYEKLLITQDETGRAINDKWMKAANQISIEEFADATKGFQPTGYINTRVEFPDFTDVETAWKRTGNNMMELMDRQVNGILRSPAVNISYLHLRKNYSGIEREYADNIVQKALRDNPDSYSLPWQRAQLERRAKDLSEKRFTELAMEEAADTVLKFADNPGIRTNFAVSVRTVGRFYRATEDFYRRIYRLKDVAPRVLYRMRLAHLGLNASGMFYEDSEGAPYIMMPMDNIIFKATDTTIRTLTGNTDSEYKQPLFNDFTMKLTLANPSFSPDAGLPTFSGPIAALSAIGIRNLLGTVDSPAIQKVGQEIDNMALGPIGDNIDIARAIIPSTLLKIYQTLPVNEKSRQEVTAAQQAIAYNAANGKYLEPNATDEEKYKYLKNIRISAHNVMVMRSVLGLISPVTPTVQESQGVPSYLLDVGITGLRNEFWDIYEAVYKKYGDDVQDPYEQALVIFTGKYPGKIAYTVARDTKQTKVLISKTNDMKNWSLANKKFIDTYGEAAYIFGPHTGDFNAGVFNWMQASGLLEDKKLEQYYDDVLVAEDKQKYFGIASWEKESLATETRVSERKFIIDSATTARKQLLASNPLLLGAITGGGNEIATEERMLRSLKQVVMDNSDAVSSGTKMKLKVAIQAMEDFVALANDEEVRGLYNATQIKRDTRTSVEALLDQLGSQDFAIKEATKAIFNSILKYYSRDTYSARA